MDEKVLNRLRQYIARCEWKWARTMPDCPHEYIYQGRCALSYDEYMDFLYAQVTCGEPAYFGKRLIPYLYIDGYKYWTMGGYDPENKTMNRQLLFDNYDQIADVYDSLRATPDCETQNLQMAHIIANYRKTHTTGSIFEIGCGTGLLLQHIQIDKRLYQGIEPSRKLLEQFRANLPNYSRCVRRKAFEEDGLNFIYYDNVVALFGTASHIMLPYLKRLAEHRNQVGLFLMFFEDNWTPDFLNIPNTCIPYFKHPIDELRMYFSGCEIVTYDTYVIVTNYNINWQEVLKNQYKLSPKPPTQTSLF